MNHTFKCWGLLIGNELAMSNGTPAFFDSVEMASRCLNFYYSGNGHIIPIKVTIEHVKPDEVTLIQE